MGIFLIVAAFRECCHSTGLGARSAVAQLVKTLVPVLLNLTDDALWRQHCLLNGAGRCWR